MVFRIFVIIVIIVYSLNTRSVSCQEKIDLTFSAGFPEMLLNAGLRFNMYNFQLGVNAGWTGAYSLSGNLYYHFAGSSFLSKIRPWYGMAGITYIHDNLINAYDEPPKTNRYFNWRPGRKFNRRGMIIALDVGILYLLNNTSDSDWDRFPTGDPRINPAFLEKKRDCSDQVFI